MKKSVFIVCLLFIFSGCTSSYFYMKGVRAKDSIITNNFRVAVIQENWGYGGVSNFIPRALITEFLELGFTVVERSQLEKILKDKGIKQVWLAREIRKSPAELNRWLKGKRRPSYENMIKIAKALNISVEEIFFNK